LVQSALRVGDPLVLVEQEWGKMLTLPGIEAQPIRSVFDGGLLKKKQVTLLRAPLDEEMKKTWIGWPNRHANLNEPV